MCSLIVVSQLSCLHRQDLYVAISLDLYVSSSDVATSVCVVTVFFLFFSSLGARKEKWEGFFESFIMPFYLKRVVSGTSDLQDASIACAVPSYTRRLLLLKALCLVWLSQSWRKKSNLDFSTLFFVS